MLTRRVKQVGKERQGTCTNTRDRGTEGPKPRRRRATNLWHYTELAHYRKEGILKSFRIAKKSMPVKRPQRLRR